MPLLYPVYFVWRLVAFTLFTPVTYAFYRLCYVVWLLFAVYLAVALLLLVDCCWLVQPFTHLTFYYSYICDFAFCCVAVTPWLVVTFVGYVAHVYTFALPLLVGPFYVTPTVYICLLRCVVDSFTFYVTFTFTLRFVAPAPLPLCVVTFCHTPPPVLPTLPRFTRCRCSLFYLFYLYPGCCWLFLYSCCWLSPFAPRLPQFVTRVGCCCPTPAPLPLPLLLPFAQFTLRCGCVTLPLPLLLLPLPLCCCPLPRLPPFCWLFCLLRFTFVGCSVSSCPSSLRLRCYILRGWVALRSVVGWLRLVPVLLPLLRSLLFCS